tara:strand:- start:629 stop:1012 length:384 start_codon:yes stop_codon:yes gene_type:complete
MTIDKTLYEVPDRFKGPVAKKFLDLSPKTQRVVRDYANTSTYSRGGKVEKLTPGRGQVIPFPVKPGTEQDWMKSLKKAVMLDEQEVVKREDYLELLNKVFGENALKDLTEDELKDLLQYTIETGGVG